MVGTAVVEKVFREQSGRAIASLVRRLGDIDLAEECVQEAFVEALRRWPSDGLPPSPAGWIITTARNRAIDRIRREATREERHRQALLLDEGEHPGEEEPVEDDRLRLIFTCCHPALELGVRVALTLRLVCGLRTEEVAAAFLVPEATMAQRLVRAKRKIKAARIPYRVPDGEELAGRLRAVLAVIYLVYSEAHLASGGERLTRDDLASEAIRLARLLAELMPGEPEVMGLLALLLLTESRRPARTDAAGHLVRLSDQDRRRWDRALIAEGHALVRACLARNEPGPYQLQAAIAAVHADAGSAADTDWRQVVALYDQLLAFDSGPVVELNRAVAVAELEGPAAALAILDRLSLDGHHRFHAARGDFLERLGRHQEAAAAFDRAISLAANAAERAHLEERRRALEG